MSGECEWKCEWKGDEWGVRRSVRCVVWYVGDCMPLVVVIFSGFMLDDVRVVQAIVVETGAAPSVLLSKHCYVLLHQLHA